MPRSDEPTKPMTLGNMRNRGVRSLFAAPTYSAQTMTLILRRMRAQDRIEGREPVDTGEDDYAVVDETRIGRIYMEPIHGEMKWRWFLQTVPAPPPNSGMADTLDEAKAAIAKRYREVLGRLLIALIFLFSGVVKMLVVLLRCSAMAWRVHDRCGAPNIQVGGSQGAMMFRGPARR
jgi:hypothetical protein